MESFLLLWSPLDMPLVVFINVPMCSRSHSEADENNFHHVLWEHAVNQYDSLAKWKTAWTMWLSSPEATNVICPIPPHPHSSLWGFALHFKQSPFRQGWNYACWLLLYHFAKGITWRYVLPFKPANTLAFFWVKFNIFFFIFCGKNGRDHAYRKTRQEWCTHVCVMKCIMVSNPSASVWT